MYGHRWSWRLVKISDSRSQNIWLSRLSLYFDKLIILTIFLYVEIGTLHNLRCPVISTNVKEKAQITYSTVSLLPVSINVYTEVYVKSQVEPPSQAAPTA